MLLLNLDILDSSILPDLYKSFNVILPDAPLFATAKASSYHGFSCFCTEDFGRSSSTFTSRI